MGRGAGHSVWVAALAAVLAYTGAPRAAHAYTAAGDRLFSAMLVLPQFAPGDEFYSWDDTMPQTPAGVGSATRESNFSAVYAKTITDRLGIVLEETWTRLDRVQRGTWSAMQNFDAEVKYLAAVDKQHEFLMSVGLDREFGGTGAARVGAFASGATTPRLYLAKGLGDLDIGYLRPLAVGAMLGYQVADAAPRSNLYTPGFFIQYSIPYLESKVQTLPLPEFVRHLTPITEIQFSIPSGRSFGMRTMALVAPGISYAGAGWELAAEALIPATAATGRGIGGIAELHLSLDYLLPDKIGRPLWSSE